MTIEWLDMRGVALLHGRRSTDERGDFRVHLEAEASEALGVGSPPTTVASAHNTTAGTVRGIHYQVEPFAESKILWCSAGALFDVLVDLRPEEPTYGQWRSVRLDRESDALHVPPGVAHGYQTLADDTVVTYLIHGQHDPGSARTLLWNDPHVGVSWPLEPTAISVKDREGSPWPPRP